ncbi:hypothetical protein HDV06_004103 [Boothiomyces sp. JEL0866]|nr:hypothetical protein HDV06_007084 [Boothiomyces sp. JEL0866]KAJ3321567.1 hypothetical protein HDV06_004103 [Boothiomyces sp. JEL0866]
MTWNFRDQEGRVGPFTWYSTKALNAIGVRDAAVVNSSIFFAKMKLNLSPVIVNENLEQLNDKLYCYYFTELKNAQELLALMKSTDSQFPNCTVLDAKHLLSVFQIQQACTKAYLNQRNKKMRSKSIYTEILLSFSHNTSISEAFKLFGLSKKTSEIIVIIEGCKLDEIKEYIQGDYHEEPQFNSDLKFIGKAFGVTDINNVERSNSVPIKYGSVRADCTSIPSTSICSSFVNQQINITSAAFESNVQPFALLLNLVQPLECPGLVSLLSSGDLQGSLRYATTFTCTLEIAQNSCKSESDTRQNSMCYDTCSIFQHTLQAAVNNATLCPSTFNTNVQIARQILVNSVSQSCKVDNGNGCVPYIKAEETNCGFGNSATAANLSKQWCTLRPFESCCQSVSTTASLSSPDVANVQPSSNGSSSQGLPVGIIVLIVLIIAVVLIALGVFVVSTLRSKRKAKNLAIQQKVPDIFSALDLDKALTKPQPLDLSLEDKVFESSPSKPKSISSGETELNAYSTIVTQDYTAMKDDELTIKIGQSIHVLSVFADGWGQGVLDDGQSGMFPVVCVASL